MKVIINTLLALAWISAAFAVRPGSAAGTNDLPMLKTAPVDDAEYQYYFPLILLTSPPGIGDLRSEWYLMVDDEHIQSRNVGRVYHPFVKYPGNPILVADQPWEGKVVQLYGTVLPGFRMWYSSYSHATDTAHVLYAESTDGLNWLKPNLYGSGKNILFDGARAVLPSLIHLPQDRNQPYRLMVYQGGVFNGFRSPNGTSTTAYPENPLFSNNSDVALFYYDPSLNYFRGTAKDHATVNGISRRAVGFIDSVDMISWVKQPDLLAPDPQDDSLHPGYYPQFYGMPVFQIGEQYLGLLWVLTARDKSGEIGKTHIQIASSHDGTHWVREEGNRPPLLDHGHPGAWDDGQVYTSNRPVIVGDELWLYYSGCDQEHSTNLPATTCSIGLATVRYNRLVSLAGTGAVLTRELSASGRKLHLNYDAGMGELRVQLSANGAPIPGYEADNCMPLVDDSQDQTVTWIKGSSLPETPFQIEIRLYGAAIYGFALLDQ